MVKHTVIKEGKLLVCLGGGYFGAKAARLGKECRARTIIIDTNPDCAAREIVDIVLTGQETAEAGQVSLIVGDAMEILFSILEGEVPAPMYELLEFSASEAVDYYKIFVSCQFDGVGGVPGAVVKKTLKYLASLTPPYSLAIGTSCRCHGILSLFKVEGN